MELRHLRTFRTVATLMSFNKASKVLNYAQSSISVQIQALERDLDNRLFDRRGKKLFLTDAGRELLVYCDRLLALADEARERVTAQGVRQGTLNVRVPESLGLMLLPGLLGRFRQSFPDIRLALHACSAESLPRDLFEGVYDLAFLLAESVDAAVLQVERLGCMEIVPVAASGHTLTDTGRIPLAMLAAQPLLLGTSDCSYRKSFERLLAGEGLTPGSLTEVAGMELLKRLVAGGAGYTMLPWPVAREEMQAGRMVLVDCPEARMEVAVLMITHREKWHCAVLRAFMDMARQEATRIGLL
ncbi:transcriptional regulator [Desulfocurvibacter africanus PCS]|uniref:Transcriptional regulator n=1 Tax=Desulfocurvibacter africanus PCS TaxID=1262666 RepID=M5PZY0_DESAF|nr:LysR family transcriptional regulator [Desulfocurvibacter africanus]EMG36236.1 transcriptional regulator [Desulfocurvibacter africanus PCS]